MREKKEKTKDSIDIYKIFLGVLPPDFIGGVVPLNPIIRVKINLIIDLALYLIYIISIDGDPTRARVEDERNRTYV